MPRKAHHVFRLRHNDATGMYSIEENGITYTFDFGMMCDMKKHIRIGRPSIESWYLSLDRFKRNEVTRTGKISKEKNDFYPDHFHDE